MRFDYQRRLAASVLRVGLNRVYISPDPKEQENILDAITREGIRGLIRRNVIQKRPERGVSRGRARHRAAQRAKGRRRGHGSREGALNARTPQKTRWIGLIRGMRRRLRELKKEGRIDVPTYRRFYRQSKGGMFKSKAHMEQQLRAAGALKEAAK
jgi:large subunit ribosomal protein L19e